MERKYTQAAKVLSAIEKASVEEVKLTGVAVVVAKVRAKFQ